MIESVRIERIDSMPSIKIHPSSLRASHEQLLQADRAWDAMVRKNPRYFNGAMLAFQSFDKSFDRSSNTIHASVEQYKHHAVRDQVHLGLQLLAVTGIVCYADDDDNQRYLIGKRSPETHRYGNLYEFGPCGGIDVPADQSSCIEPNEIISELLRESKEEAQISLTDAELSPLAIVHDEKVGSVDIVVMTQIKSPPAISTGWEYLTTEWKSLTELRAMCSTDPCMLIPTTQALIQILGE